MSNRYTTIDVIVGVGLCAIVFGALLLFVAASGTFQAAPVAYAPLEQPTGLAAGMAMLQPARGQEALHLVPRLIHQAAVDAQDARAFENDVIVEVDLDRLGGKPEGRETATLPESPEAHADESHAHG